MTAAVLRRRLAATSPDRLDAAAMIELLGEAEIALLDSGAAIARGRALVALGTPATVTSWSRTASVFSDPHSRRRTRWMPGRISIRALAAFSHAGIPYRTAQMRLLLARLLGRNDREVAGAGARAALSVFEDLGARRDTDAGAALMRDLGVKAARARPRNIGRLTKREQEVLVVLGEGLSNPRSPNACSSRARRSSITWRASSPSSAWRGRAEAAGSRRGALPKDQPEMGEFADALAPAGLPSWPS